MSNERDSIDYKGQKILVYEQRNEWWWRVTIFDKSLKFQVKTSIISPPSSYSTKVEAIESAKRYIDIIVTKE